MVASRSSTVVGAFAFILILSFLYPFSGTHPLQADQHDGLDWQFTEQERQFSFRGSFLVSGIEDCLLEVIYDFQHICRYSAGATSMEKGLEGDDWYDVTYTYQRFCIFRNRSTWHRTLNRAGQRVDFEMTASANSLRIMPELLSSTGYYQLSKEQGGYRLEYFQECFISD